MGDRERGRRGRELPPNLAAGKGEREREGEEEPTPNLAAGKGEREREGEGGSFPLILPMERETKGLGVVRRETPNPRA